MHCVHEHELHARSAGSMRMRMLYRRDLNTALRLALRASAAGFHVLRTARRATEGGSTEDGYKNAVSLGNSCGNAPKTALNGSGGTPRGPEDCPRAPRCTQERPKSAKNVPKRAPRASQERPKSAQEGPKSAQEHPKRGQEDPKRVPRARPGRQKARPTAARDEKCNF